MKRKLIYLFIAFAAAILPAHAQKFLNDALTLSNVSLWQQGNSLYVSMTFDMKNLTIGSARSLKDAKKHISAVWQSLSKNLPPLSFLIIKGKLLIIRR